MTLSMLAAQMGLTLNNLIFIAARVLLIAVVFEFLAWFAARRLEGLAGPFIGLDEARERSWRTWRRATLRGAPRLLSRTLLYTVALILVLEVFGVPVLPLSLAIAAVAALLGLAFVPLMRDYAQGYILLAEDSLAPGDLVEIAGRRGQVEKWTMRATWLREESGAVHVLSNRDVRDVTILARPAAPEAVTTKPRAGKKVAFDPLDA